MWTATPHTVRSARRWTVGSTRRQLRQPSDLPLGEHFAILEFSSVFIPGDERSRTNPGHGYPAETRPTLECIVYPDRVEWESEIQRRAGNRQDQGRWVPVIVRRVGITTKVIVEVDRGK